MRVTASDPHPAGTLSEGRNASKARVRTVRWHGIDAVEKDYAHRPWPVRLLLGPLMLGREERALRRLAGAEGFPCVLARPESTRLVLSRLPGTPLREMLRTRDPLPERFFDRLADLLATMHRLGVAQGDIGLGDVLVQPDGSPALLDFSVSVVRGQGILGKTMFGLTAAQDNRRLARLRRRFKATDPRISGFTSTWSATAGRLRLAGLYALLAFWAWSGMPEAIDFWLGLPFVAAGALTRTWAAGHLRKTDVLAVSGPYARCRHPLYLGRLLLWVGFALMARLPGGIHLATLAGGLALFFGYYLPRKERVEGTRLMQVHGAAYERYRVAVPALRPLLRPFVSSAPAARWRLTRFLLNRESLMLALESSLLLLFALRAFA